MTNNKTYKMKRAVDLYEENSFGITRERDQVETDFTVVIKENGEGWFEMDGGADWYAEGGLELEGRNVVGYDGVFSLPQEIEELLTKNGYNCDEI